MPDKHIKFGESLLGLGSQVLVLLSKPKSIDELWYSFRVLIENNGFPTDHTFEHLVLAVDVLYTIGLIVETETPGVLKKCV